MDTVTLWVLVVLAWNSPLVTPPIVIGLFKDKASCQELTPMYETEGWPGGLIPSIRPIKVTQATCIPLLHLTQKGKE